ncbi:RecBCD enzyme subunit RecD (plasmid) [Burkholderia sp. SFA1]|nr:DNA helicase/exodeoxyribonuclease V, alpha subunit [Burkholderia sp. YI23]BBQ03292.1 RecBCD enzyme subunit RecD [Burkholderia sp. SFA1]
MSSPFFAVVTDTPFDARRALENAQDAMQLLGHWVERGWLREIDAAFANFLAHEAQEASGLVILAAALASHQLGRGHACLDLAAALFNPTLALSLPPAGACVPGADHDDGDAERALLPLSVLNGVTLSRWTGALKRSALVSAGDASNDTPLVLTEPTSNPKPRLYLRRYWRYEQDVCRAIGERIAPAKTPDTAWLRSALDALFPPPAAARTVDQAENTDHADWQKLACALAAKNAFSIVTGGPGTGKTTTVVKLLALLQAEALARNDDPPPLRIRLAAPTGKAAARLNESIAGAVAKLPLDAFPHADEIRKAIPVNVTTLHRLLGTVPGSRRFRHHAGRPLSLDVLVIDEASMVDLEMMNAVLVALPARARLVLLGDKDQLASVEAGAVLGELCSGAAGAHYTADTRAWLEAASGERVDARYGDAAGRPLDQSIAMLRKSHRFSSASEIGKLAEAVNAGQSSEIPAILATGGGDIAYVDCAERGDAVLGVLAIEGVAQAQGASDDLFVNASSRHGYRHYLETMHARQPPIGANDEAYDAWAHAVLHAHGEFQLLCALRRGPWGVEGLNRRIARLLQEAGLIHARGEWYAGRPVLVTQNDYELGLMNGDIGITLLRREAPDNPRLHVAFAAGDGTSRIRWVLPSRLQAVETVFALTVHKSQGSEFTHAALVLPDKISPVLTRELVYTGITRARRFLTIASAGGMALVEQAVRAQVERASGVSEAFDTQ